MRWTRKEQERAELAADKLAIGEDDERYWRVSRRIYHAQDRVDARARDFRDVELVQIRLGALAAAVRARNPL